MSDKALTTFEVSKICDVYPSTVKNWIDEGRLTAYKTPGGHRRVKKSDLLIFVEKYNLPSNFNFKKDTEYKLLIIDDSALLADTVKVMDTKLSFSVQTVNTEFDAGFIIGKWEPDLIIIDFSVNAVNCRRICRRLKSDAQLKNIPLVAVLGYDENAGDIAQPDYDCYINKPVQVSQFSKKIELLLM